MNINELIHIVDHDDYLMYCKLKDILLTNVQHFFTYLIFDFDKML